MNLSDQQFICALNFQKSARLKGLHRIFLEAALFLLCAAGSLQEHVCRVYPAFSSAYFGAELLNSNGAFSGSSAASTSDLDSSA